MLTAIEGVTERELEREKMEWIRMAWFTSILLAPYNNGKPVDFNMLLPEQFKIERPVEQMSREEALKELEGIKKRLGIE